MLVGHAGIESPFDATLCGPVLRIRTFERDSGALPVGEGIHPWSSVSPTPHGDSLVYTVTGKAGVGQMQGLRKPRCIQTLTQREGASVINSPSPPLVRTPGGSPRFLCQVRRLVKNQGTNQVTALQGRSSALGNMPPTWVPCGHASHAPVCCGY